MEVGGWGGVGDEMRFVQLCTAVVKSGLCNVRL